MLGGTFDPVHNGHLAIARRARVELQLHHVLLVPNGQPPHRAAPSATGAQRLAMLHAAVGDCDVLRVDDRELRRTGPSYTVDTLTELRAGMAVDVRLVLLLGADAFADIRQWSRWRQVFELAEVAVLARPGTHPVPAGVPRRALTFLEGRELDISSSTVRARLAAGEPIDTLVPPAVGAIIEREGLYR